MPKCSDPFFSSFPFLPMPVVRPGFTLANDTHLHMEQQPDWTKPIPTGCDGKVSDCRCGYEVLALPGGFQHRSAYGGGLFLCPELNPPEKLEHLPGFRNSVQDRCT